MHPNIRYNPNNIAVIPTAEYTTYEAIEQELLSYNFITIKEQENKKMTLKNQIYEFKIMLTCQLRTNWADIPIDHADEFVSGMGAATHASIDIVGEDKIKNIESVQYVPKGSTEFRYVPGNAPWQKQKSSKILGNK